MENIDPARQDVEIENHASIFDIENPNSTLVEIENQASIDIENPNTTLVTTVRRKLTSLSPLSSECCVYRVPGSLRKINAAAYTPRVVSIGPLHRGKQSLEVMEEHKLRYLKKFLQRTEPEISVEDCVNAIKGWEERARCCYSEVIDLSSDEFVEMILVDGAFVIELFLLDYFPEWRDKNDRLFYKSWMQDDVFLDMKLLENQLPFFVLDRLFDLAFGSRRSDLPPLIKLTHCYFETQTRMGEVSELNSNSEVSHFLDVLRYYYLPSTRRSSPKHYERCEFTRSVTELHKAGVEFKKGTSNCLLDIILTCRVLQIPPIMVEDGTEILFRNLIALEQCHYQQDSYIVDYIVLMNFLIKTPDDVDLLVKTGIIENRLGDNMTVATLFKNLGKETKLWGKNFYFSSLCNQLNAYYKSPCTIILFYFSTPWAIILFFAAVLLLVHTFK